MSEGPSPRAAVSLPLTVLMKGQGGTGVVQVWLVLPDRKEPEEQRIDR